MKIEQFVKKINNTELNHQSTNDAYLRISKEIQDGVPSDFFIGLNSKKIEVINRKTKNLVDSWVRFQHYPSNDEYRIVSLSSIYKTYQASPGDYVYIEKIQNGDNIHYEIYMKQYVKICLKYSRSNKAFEILNEEETIKMEFLNKNINLFYKGSQFMSNIIFSHSKKKRTDSPIESNFYKIENIPNDFYNSINKESFIEVVKRGDLYYLEIPASWSFYKFIK